MFYEKYVDLCIGIDKTPTAVALDIGISRATVTNWKKGAIPNDVTIKKIANYFNVSVNYLIGDCEKVAIHDNTISGQYAIFGNSNSPMNLANELNSQEQVLLVHFRKLSEIQKATALIFVTDLAEKAEK